MRWLYSLLVLFALALPARAELVLNVTLDYDQERDHVGTQNVFNDLASYLGKAVGQPVRLVMTQNAERVGEHIRTGSYSVLLAPAQMVGLAMRNDYEPVARTEKTTRIVLLARKASKVANLEQAKGKRLVLPHRESLVSYLLRGEFNALGLSPSSYFSNVTYVNKYGAAIYAMDIGQADLVAAKEEVAKKLFGKRNDVVQVRAFAEVPEAGVVVNKKLDPALRDRLRQAFYKLDKGLEDRLVRAGFGAMEPADTPDFEYVSHRGFFTPEVLPGVTIPTAEQVHKLMSQGVPLFDVRPNTHYREGHIPGAKNVPYQLNSPKEVDYDDSVDKFDISQLPKEKSAPMIFQCNGAECWYSYKAARYMAKRGYTKVYWFRTGLPAWKAAGYPVEK